MTKIIPFLQQEAFGPDALRAISTAPEEVCRMLNVAHDQGARGNGRPHRDLARRGERDPERLRDLVLRDAGATPGVVDPAPALMRWSQIVSTGSMNDQPKDDQPKDAVPYALGAASIAVLIGYVASHWWM